MQVRSSISRRLMWLNVLVSGAALIITAFALLIYDQTSYRRILIENVNAQADVVGQNSISALVFNDPESARNTLSGLSSVPTVLSASLFSSDQRLFATYSRSPRFTISSLPDFRTPERFEGQQIVAVHALHSGDRVAGYLVIRADTSGIRARRNRYLLIVGAVLALSLFAAVTLSTAFRRAVAKPIVELANAARKVSAEQNYAVRVPPTTTRDEISVLVDAFNEMLSGIHTRDVALETERSRLQTILDNAPVGILVLDAQSSEVIVANQTVIQILGENLLISGRSPFDWVVLRPDRHFPDREDRPMGRALRGETTVGEEYIVVRADGTETWVRASAAPVRGKKGEVLAGLLVLVAIDDQKKAQEALLQSEKLAAAGRLAASISHEINNPLESVTNLLYIALSDASISPEVRALLTQADQELARVSHIATQTLRFYRQSTKPSSIDMGYLIDSVLQLLAAKLRNTDVRVETDYATREPIVCFEGEMRQVFTNLFSNALDATSSGGGKLIVRTKVLRRSSRHGSGIQITVADNGNGIPADLSRRIFEPFYTTKGNRGTGLGLWVTKEIVAKHKGTIRVRSQPGHGTVFVVFLPFGGAEQRAQEARVAS